MIKIFLMTAMFASAKWVPAPVQNFPLNGSAHVIGQTQDLTMNSGQIQMQGDEIIKANFNIANGEKPDWRFMFNQVTKTAEGLSNFGGEVSTGDKTESLNIPIKIKNSDQEILGDGTFKVPNSPDLEIHFRGEKHPTTTSW